MPIMKKIKIKQRMAKSESLGGVRPNWFVGAYFSDTGDQTDHFIAEGNLEERVQAKVP